MAMDSLRNSGKKNPEKSARGQYETYANIGLNEWITMKIVFKDKQAKLFLNKKEHYSFIVNEMKELFFHLLELF